MTRFAVLASAALAASFVSAAPAPAPHDVHNFEIGANANDFNWGGAISSWFSVRPGVRTVSFSHSHTHSHHHGHHKWHSRTRTASAPAATTSATSSVVEATSLAAEATSSAAEVTSSAVQTTSVAAEPAPEPTTSAVETSAAVETSSIPQATSTVVPTTSAAPTTSATPTTTAAPKTTSVSTSVKPTTSAKPTTTSVAPTTSAAASTGNADIDAYLKGHNDIRAQHGAVALTWADDLAAAAAKWAGNCVWEHSQGKVGSFGENLAAGTGLTAAAAVKMWTDESVDYDPANPQYSHFTQVVWKATTEVGCAVTSCTGLLTGYSGAVQYHVCEYRAPGNVIGQFAQNVQA